MNSHFSSLFGDIGKEPVSPEKGGAFVVVSGNFPENGIAVPLDSRAVFVGALEQLALYKGKSFFGKRKFRPRNSWVLAGWAKSCLKNFFLAADGKNGNIFSFLKSKLGEDVAFSIYVGSRKFNLPLFRMSDGTMIGFAKIYPVDGVNSDYGENEAKTLEYLNELDFGLFLFPKVISKAIFKNHLAVILSPGDNLENTKTITPHHISFVGKLVKNTGRKVIFDDSGFYRVLVEEIKFLESKVPGQSALINTFFKESIKRLKGRNFVFSLVMREFPYFHMIKSAEKFFVVDFEEARPDFPPIFDIFSLFMSASRLKGNYIEIYRNNLNNIFFRENYLVKKYMANTIDKFGINKEDAYWFFWLFLLDQLYIHLHVGHDSSAERILSFLDFVSKDLKSLEKRWMPSL